jgi:hypothetical protein
MKRIVSICINIIAHSLILSLPSYAAEDLSPPKLLSLTIPARARLGDTIEVAAKVVDDLSGVETVSIWVRKPNGINTIGSNNPAHYDENRKLYVTSITINEHDVLGIWKVCNVGLRDKVGNYINLEAHEINAECLVVK